VVKPAANADPNAIPELGNDLTPPTTSVAPGAAPPLPPTQVNDAPKAAADPNAPASADANATPATTADPTTESSSKKKKKHHFPF
jgi:hypothetical protein